MADVDLSGYEEVPDRIKKFFEKHPEGSLQALSVEYRELPTARYDPGAEEWVLAEPRLHVIYTAAAYRTPDDPRPGIGSAQEPIPGLTPYTRGSELMNAETSAWGRALVALGFVAKKVASAHEVRSREGGSYGTAPDTGEVATEPQKKRIRKDLKSLGADGWEPQALLYRQLFNRELPEDTFLPDAITKRQASAVIERLKQGALPTGASDIPSGAEDFAPPAAEPESDQLFPPAEDDGVPADAGGADDRP